MSLSVLPHTQRWHQDFSLAPCYIAQSYYFVANHSLLSKINASPMTFTLEISQCMDTARPFWQLCSLHQKWFDAQMLSISSEEEKASRPTPRTALMHSSSKTMGSLRTSLLPSEVLIPFRDWTTMDWTVIFTWKTDSCQLSTLAIINFGSFCVIMCVTFPGSVPQQQHSVILWTTAVLQVLLKLSQRVWV